ncbi:MAG: adenosylcobinamide-GDP ribazoletransferase [Desulfuromonas sp.]|nr:adenosylcobinamide-GDP ribazoletransferase [Desulfuromonas sp.]
MSYLQPFCAAMTFLTIIRLPQRWCGEQSAMERSLIWFPLVGLLIGASVALLDSIMCTIFPGTLVPSAITVLALIAVSGGLHLDGVADSADAFMSSRSRERMLEIMKDSRVGAMGSLAIAALLLLKFSALATLPQHCRVAAIILLPLAGRTALVIKTVSLPYARSGGGLASAVHSSGRHWHALVATLFLAVVSLAFFGAMGIWITLATLVTTGLFSWYCKNKIGGLTGDTLGASCELVEVVTALSALMCCKYGGLL